MKVKSNVKAGQLSFNISIKQSNMAAAATTGTLDITISFTPEPPPAP